MKNILIAVLICFPFLLKSQERASSLNNPIVTIYDGCVERFMGHYYAMGTGTMGKMYQSKNLISWSGPTLAAETNEATWLNDPKWTQAYTYKRIGAGDILYRNGVFHIYFNGIGHSYSDKPTGMYKEHSINEPFDDYGIDAQVFQDDDGKLYYVKKVNPDDPHPLTGQPYAKGPEIWAFDMNSPFIRKGINGTVQMTHQLGHPTNVDFFNFEGPELFKYRGSYYNMFSPNRMSARTGMYQIGVAQSDKPTNFSNAKKYPHPVLTRNTENHQIIYKQLLHTGEHGSWDAKYINAAPLGNWYESSYDDSAWVNGKGGFGLKNMDLAVVRSNRTIWNTNKLYVRRKFSLDALPVNAALKYRVEANTNFYINGNKLSINASSTAYSLVDIDSKWLKEGENIIAVEAENSCSGESCFKFVDFGLFDTGEAKAEKIVMGQSQANYVVGPNGFERWVMYKGFFNGISAQGIDRMHFYDKELVIESSSSLNSPGYHPLPASPTFISYFDHPIYYPYEFMGNSDWTISGGIFKAKNDGAQLLFRGTPMTNYRYEIPFRMPKGSSDYASVYAYYKDENNWLKVSIDRDSEKWSYEINENGSSVLETQNLPVNFKFLEDNLLVSHYEEPWHTLTIYKNGSRFNVELDYFKLTSEREIETAFSGCGRIGLEASSPHVSFDAIQYTQGWDEWDQHITGWTSKRGNWNVSDKGMQQTETSNVAEAVKGDKLKDYEFSVYMKNDKISSSGKLGYYPLYVDEKNYVKAVINYATGKLEIEKKGNGNSEENLELDLSQQIARQYTVSNYPTNSYRYDFRSETEVSGIDILWFEGYYPYLKQTFDLPNDVKFYALQEDNTWILLNSKLEGELRFAYFNKFAFDKVKTKAIRMDVTPKNGMSTRAFSAYFQEELASGYYLRCRRENGKLYLFVNDMLKATLNGNWDASQVGLYTESASATFNGILHYQTGKVAVSKIEPRVLTCGVGESVKLEADVLPTNATNSQLVWQSSNPLIASIENNSILTRHTEGDVTITAWSVDGGLVKGAVILDSSTAISEEKMSKLMISPNPVTDLLSITTESPITKAGLYTLMGNQIKEYLVSGEQFSEELPMGDIPCGVYMLHVKTLDETASGKIIKTK